MRPIFLAAALLSLTACGSLSAAYDGLSSPQGVEDRATLKADALAFKAKILLLAPQFEGDYERIAEDYRAGNLVGVLVSVVAAAPRIAVEAPALVEDLRTIIEDLRRLGVDAGLVQKADAEVSRAKARAKEAKLAAPPKSAALPVLPAPEPRGVKK